MDIARSKIDVSVVLVHYRTYALTRNCIKSIISLTRHLDFEILLIDNMSSDGSVEALEAEFPGVRIIRNKHNSGFASACNIGMSCAIGRYFFIINSDAYLVENSMVSMVNRMKERQEVDVLGCMIKNSDGEVQASILSEDSPSFFSLMKGIFLESALGVLMKKLLRKSFVPAYDHSVEQKVVVCSGACLMIRREVFEKAGGFDPDFFLYCEETEWMRERLNGRFGVFYTPQTYVIHDSGGSGGGNSRLQNELSYFLYLYKVNPLYYMVYLFGYFFILLTWLPVVFLKEGFSEFKKYSKSRLRVTYLAATRILLYSRKFGSRGDDYLKYLD